MRSRPLRTLVLVALFVLLACSMLWAGCYRIDLTGDGRFLCRDEAHECPDGFRCRLLDFVCVRSADRAGGLKQPSPGDGGADSDASGSD